MIDWTKATKEELKLFVRIAKRAETTCGTRQAIIMDLQAAHTCGCPLKLTELAEANINDLLHDIHGINQHLNRTTGELEDCFPPRYAV
ncbi:MAG: hypothetical protein KAS32_10675 [Candidatus Peribacteraceae bacterium]|nr:hypothetical protein [Candidatus Peribacteraceae bacterium]